MSSDTKIGLSDVVGTVFVILKCFKLIDISWWWVVSPWWIMLIFYTVVELVKAFSEDEQ